MEAESSKPRDRRERFKKWERGAWKEGPQERARYAPSRWKTEFSGVPTRTCLAIGPDMGSKIDAVTGNLELY